DAQERDAPQARRSWCGDAGASAEGRPRATDRRRPDPVPSLRTGQAKDGASALQQRAGKADSGEDLPRLLARMDRHGDEGDQRAAPATIGPTGAEGVRSAHDGIFKPRLADIE